MSTRVSFLSVLLVIVGVAGVSNAQRADVAQLRQQLLELQGRVAKLERAALGGETVAEAVQEVNRKLQGIEQRLAATGREHKSLPDAIATIDQLQLQVRALEQEIATLKTAVADVEHPWSGPSKSEAGAGGVSLATADGRYSLTLGGYVQPRVQLTLAEDLGDIVDTTFRLRRARFGGKGKIGSDRLTYKFLMSLVKSPSALDFFGDVRIAKNVKVRFGQYKVQFTRGFITSSSKVAFPENNSGHNRVRYDRDLQIGVHGKLVDDRIGYYAGIGNGAGANRVNDNIDYVLVARSDVVVLGKRFAYSFVDSKHTDKPAVMLGAGITHDLVALPMSVGGVQLQNRDVDGDGEVDNVRVVSASADAVFRYKGFEAVAEGFWRNEKWGTILNASANPDLSAAVGARSKRNYLGFYAHANYMVVPRKLAVGARVGHARLPFLGIGGRSSSIPKSDRLWEIDGLVQLYDGRGSRVVGLQYTFDNYNARTGPDPANDKEHRVIIESQLKF